MIAVMTLTLGLALVDSLNPATIATMAVLLPLVKRAEHALAFLISTYIVYFAGGVFLYYGLDQFVVRFIGEALERFGEWIYVAEILLGVSLLVLGSWLLTKPRRERTAMQARDVGLRSLRPRYLLGFGVVSTLSDLPTALPLLGFTGRMVELQPAPPLFLGLLSVYVLIYVLPLLLLYGVYKRMQSRLHVVSDWAFRIIHAFMRYALPPLLAGLGIVLIVDGWPRVL